MDRNPGNPGSPRDRMGRLLARLRRTNAHIGHLRQLLRDAEQVRDRRMTQVIEVIAAQREQEGGVNAAPGTITTIASHYYFTTT